MAGVEAGDATDAVEDPTMGACCGAPQQPLVDSMDNPPDPSMCTLAVTGFRPQQAMDVPPRGDSRTTSMWPSTIQPPRCGGQDIEGRGWDWQGQGWGKGRIDVGHHRGCRGGSLELGQDPHPAQADHVSPQPTGAGSLGEDPCHREDGGTAKQGSGGRRGRARRGPRIRQRVVQGRPEQGDGVCTAARAHPSRE
ncbi:hypothetical protein TRIUR3_00281 [Triticum urartu]|uniref:Uncharacterized protein n=1 Tax=Triticum urartu TaxID=4572 RepID=M7Z0P3_TRIUA|nr:hypothetical protein TRIUR3_00281 [Triticum urartu]